MSTGGKHRKAIRLSPPDNVATILEDLESGDQIEVMERDGSSFTLDAREAIPFGHKVAVQDLDPGDNVVKYGQSIGTATVRISVGQHVHTQNVVSGRGKSTG